MLIAVGVLQAIAVGTFIYVTFFEILSEELADHSSVGKVLFVVVGFMLMALLDLVPEEQIQIQQSPQHMDFSSNSSGLLTSNSTS
jgi:ZIP Zinc transporter